MALGASDLLKLAVSADTAGAIKEFDKLGRSIKSHLGDVEKQSQGLSGKLAGAFDSIAQKSPVIQGALSKIGISGREAGAAIATAIPVAGITAAGAIAVFAASAIGDFEKTALAAGKFSDATGLGVEDASRWIEVSSDINIGADTVQSAFVKMEKAISTNRGAFGNLVQTAKNGSVDLSGTFIAVIKHLQGIKDPIDRANEASKLFGRGFTGLAEILGTSADTLKEKLAGVKEGMVIDEGELKKARDYRDSMKDLGDAVDNIKLKAGGGLIGPVTGSIKDITIVVELLGKLNDYTFGGLGTAFGIISSFANPIKTIGDAWQGLTSAFTPTVTGIAEVTGAADIAAGSLKAGVVDAGGWGQAIADAANTAAAGVRDVQTAWDLLKGSLSVQDAQLSLEDSFARVDQTAKAAFEAVSTGADDSSAKVNDQKQAVNDLEQKIVSYGEKVLGLPPEVVSDILAKVDEGDLTGAKDALDKAAEERKAAFKAKEDTGATSTVERAFAQAARERSALMKATAETGAAISQLDGAAHSRAASISASANTGSAERELNNTARSRTADITVNLHGGPGTLVRFSARGSNYFPGGLSVVGEEGPELVELPRGSKIHTANETRRMVGSSGPSGLMSSSAPTSTVVNITIQGAVDPYSTARQIQTILAKGGYAGFSAKAA